MNLTAYIGERLEEKKILLMTHVIVGYPSLDVNWEMLEAMAEVGVDMVELQMPFSPSPTGLALPAPTNWPSKGVFTSTSILILCSALRQLLLFPTL